MRSSAHTVVTVTTPLPVLPYRPRYCRPTCAVLVPSLRSPLSSITSTPPPCGAVAGSAVTSSSRREFTWSASHRDSDRKNCSRCTAGCCAPVTGSAPASAVSVLFRSRGASSPARYSRKPRRCAIRANRSSNRAAYSSSGPGAAGHGRRAVITHPTAGHATTSRHNISPLRSQQSTASAASSYVCPVDDTAESFVVGVVVPPDDVPADHAGLFLVAGMVGAVQREVPQRRELRLYPV